MRLLLLLLICGAASAGDWLAVQQIPAGRSIEIVTRDGATVRAGFVSANAESLAIRKGPGNQTVKRAEIRRVRAYSPHRRLFKGLLWMGIGAGAGAGIGYATCVYCSNEGHTPYTAPGAAAGAGLGALGFLSSPYRTVYKSK